MNALTQMLLETHTLDDGCVILRGVLPEALFFTSGRFEELWEQRPAVRHQVKIFGKFVDLPRDQQAYLKTYRYTGSENHALPLPVVLEPLLRYCQCHIEKSLNGVLVNWYEGSDYIGPHHDSTDGLVPDSPIVTISFGQQRLFRFTKKQAGKTLTHDIVVNDGAIVVIPSDTNVIWKHSVPKRAKYSDRRISVTFRSFKD